MATEQTVDDTAEKIRAIQELADAIGGVSHGGYSGRGMYGAECWAINCDNSADVIELCRENGLPRPTVDNMGMGFVCYWPNIRGKIETFRFCMTSRGSMRWPKASRW